MSQKRLRATPLAKSDETVVVEWAPQVAISPERSVLDNIELLSNILRHLTEPAEAQEAVFQDGWPNAIPPIKTGTFPLLATVNRAFFHASVGVLWENMNSLVPFLGCILPADEDEHGRPRFPLSYRTHDVTSEHWERFFLYASKTRQLVLGPSSLAEIHGGWLAYLLNSDGRPRVLFPGLRHLVAGSFSDLALFIYANAAPVVKIFEFNMATESQLAKIESARSLTVGLSRKATGLTCLKLGTVMSDIIRDVSRIETLQTLHLTIDANAEYVPLSPLANLPALETLCIVQEVDPLDRKVAAKLPSDIDIQPLTSGGVKLKHLKTLRVRANGTTHYRIASELLPRTLEQLTIEPLPDALNVQMLLVPLVIALYARRNPSLVVLQAAVPPDVDHLPGSVGALEPSSFRTDDRFAIEPFLIALAQLQSLAVLKICGVPFLRVDIASQILEVAQSLPELRSLIALPQQITRLPTDDLVLPPLRILEELSQHYPQLRSLETWVDISDAPPPPKDRGSRHGLAELSLVTVPKELYRALTTGQRFSLVQYIDGLFPSVNFNDWGGSTSENEFWRFMQESLSFFRMARASI